MPTFNGAIESFTTTSLEHDRGQEIIRDQDQNTRCDNRLGRRDADASRTTGCIKPLVATHHGEDAAEYECFDQAAENVAGINKPPDFGDEDPLVNAKKNNANEITSAHAHQRKEDRQERNHDQASDEAGDDQVLHGIDRHSV